MSARLEDERKKEEKIEKKLKNMPSFVSTWYYNLKASDITASSRGDMINKVNRFLCSINSNVKAIKLSDITKLSVNMYMGSLNDKTDSYRQSVWFCLNNFFNYFVCEGYLEKNYMATISKGKNHDLNRINKHRILLTEDDFNKILTGIDNYAVKNRLRDKAIFLILMTTGMRETALTEIDVNDIDNSNNTLEIIDKGDIEHVYPLNEVTRNAINEWMKDRKNWKGSETTEALFLSDQGNRLSVRGLDRLVRARTKKFLGKELSPHKIRAGFCSILYSKTHDVAFVSKAVGHSNPTVTMRYIVTDNSEREKSAKIFNNIFKGENINDN